MIIAKPRQTLFDSKGQIVDVDEDGLTASQRRKLAKAMDEIDRRKSIRAVCPWCLLISTLDKFTKYNNKYQILKTVTCPDCGANLRLKTTKIFDTPRDQYAWPRWLWDQVFSWHGYEKVKWDKIRERMKPYPELTQIYWEVYRNYKSKRGGQPHYTTKKPMGQKEFNLKQYLGGPLTKIPGSHDTVRLIKYENPGIDMRELWERIYDQREIMGDAFNEDAAALKIRQLLQEERSTQS